MPKESRKGPLVLLTINGWGVTSGTGLENNAIRKANVVEFKELVSSYPSTIISPYSDSLVENYQVLGSGFDIEANKFSQFSFSKILDENNLSQIKIADSENFPLVSTIFNHHEDQLNNEEWLILKDQDNFFDALTSIDEKITRKLLSSLKSLKYSFIMANLCEAGRSALKGDMAQSVVNIKKTASLLKKISQAVLNEKGTLVVVGAYGLAEEIFNINTKLPYLRPNNHPVPFLLISDKYEGRSIGFKEAPNNDISLLKPAGSFLDIAPSLLTLMDLELVPEMKGKSFV